MINIMKCSSIDEVRRNIDAIDEKIVRLICEREHYVLQAANFKKSETDVNAPKRVEQVIDKVRKIALDCNGNDKIVEKVYRTMIDAFIHREMKEFNDTKK